MASPLEVAPNLALDEAVRQRRAAGEQVIHLGFGESRVPLLPQVVQRLADGAGRTDYGPVAGGRTARAAVAGYFGRRGLPTDPDDVVLAPGSKPLLLALVAAVAGDVVLPAPAWVTYAPQAHMLGRAALRVPIPAQAGGVPDPQLLPDALMAFRAAGHDPRLLVLTVPDNPTGTTAPPDLVRAVVSVAQREGLVVVADEIYRDVVFDPTAGYLSAAQVAPASTVVVTGLSKSLGLGGWRIGAARFPAGEHGEGLRHRVTGVASHIWSNAAGPMQAVVEYAFGEPSELVAHRDAATRVHARITGALHGLLTDVGVSARPPTGGFYVYPDFGDHAEVLAARGVRDSVSLQRVLLDDAGVALLGGHAFGDDPLALRARAATSLLWGHDDDERRQTLAAPDPLGVPHVARVLDQLHTALDRLVTPGTTRRHVPWAAGEGV
jgi:aspartate aminotransferase